MKKSLILIVLISSLLSCDSDKKSNGKINIVATTSMITDIVKQIGGDAVNLHGLMGAGVDPHLYKASEGDVSKLTEADIVFFNGLHLEGKLVEVFEQIGANKKPIALGEFLPKDKLIRSTDFESNYDPHIWFDIDLYEKYVVKVTEVLILEDPKNKNTYALNSKKYLRELTKLKDDVQKTVDALEGEKRILITAHDAFRYFGKKYNFKVLGLQGISTASEAGVKDVQRLADIIIEYKVKSIFVESSVPNRTLMALKEAVKSKGYTVNIGDTLFSDALGGSNTNEGTYIGMYRYNIKAIVNALM